MTHRRRRKCRSCGELFRADARNLRHQKYCSNAACRKASKVASQRRWLSKPENRDYFRGPAHCERVRAWRAAHPGYWRGRTVTRAVAVQEDCRAQPIDTKKGSDTLVIPALQEVFAAQPLVLLGLIANLTGSALQEDIAESSRRLLRLGQDILGGRRDGAPQSAAMPPTGQAGAPAVQLGGPAPGRGPPHRAL